MYSYCLLNVQPSANKPTPSTDKPPLAPRLQLQFQPQLHLQHHLHLQNTQPSPPPWKWANDLLQKSPSNWTPQKTTQFPPKNYPNATVRFYLIVPRSSAPHARKRTNNLQARIQVVPPSSPSKVLYSTSLGIPCTVLPAHIKVCRERILSWGDGRGGWGLMNCSFRR